MTDELDLSHLRSSGLQANEELLPEDDEESESSGKCFIFVFEYSIHSV